MNREYRHSPDRYARDARYLEDVHPSPDSVLRDIERVADEEGQPITERPSARLLALAVRAMGARSALEIGTNLGYSAIWIANALLPDGELVTIDHNAELFQRAHNNFERAGVAGKIRQIHGSALDVLESVEGPFDFAYIDADKTEYISYLNAVVTRLRPGGVVAIDNLLWQGQVAHESEDSEFMRSTTPLIRTFNKVFLEDTRLDPTIVQIGDGIGLGVKR